METNAMKLNELNFILKTWKRELRFHLDEMDTFQEKLDELTAGNELDVVALKKLDILQNRIQIEKDAIAKLKHRGRNLMAISNRPGNENNQDDLLAGEHSELRDDMRDYIQLHYILKEGVMDFVLEHS